MTINLQIRVSVTKMLPLLLFSRSVTSDCLRPRGFQHTRLPCPAPSPRACCLLLQDYKWTQLFVFNSSDLNMAMWYCRSLALKSKNTVFGLLAPKFSILDFIVTKFSRILKLFEWASEWMNEAFEWISIEKDADLPETIAFLT